MAILKGRDESICRGGPRLLTPAAHERYPQNYFGAIGPIEVTDESYSTARTSSPSYET